MLLDSMTKQQVGDYDLSEKPWYIPDESTMLMAELRGIVPFPKNTAIFFFIGILI